MKGFKFLSLVCLISTLAFTGCQRDRGVEASSGVYQPRPAPTSGEMKGELLQVEATGKSIGIRVENGMVQTFQCDADTSVEGMPDQPQAGAKKASKTSKMANNEVRSLAGREGSELTVRWDSEDGSKMARDIEVTQLSTANKTTRRARRR